MRIHYYKADSPEAAFEQASRDASKWCFAELEALGEMASAFHDGFTPTQRSGSGLICTCNSGIFQLFDDKPDCGYGIALVQLRGHKVGIDNPVANEILEFHRARRDEVLFADQLLTWSENVSTLADLDRGYHLLEQACLIERTGNTVIVKDSDGQEHERPGFVCRTRTAGPIA